MLSMQKKFLSLIFVLASITAVPVYAVPFFESSVKARYEKMLAQEDAQIKTEIFKLAGMIPAWEKLKDFIRLGWRQEKDSLIDAYEQETLKHVNIAHNTSFSPSFLTITQRLLANQNMLDVKILPNSDDTADAITIHHKLILVSEECIGNYCKTHKEIEAMLLHEIMHIKNDDCLVNTYFALLEAEYSNPETAEQWHAVIKKMNKFCEKRADLQAGLVSLEYAKAMLAVAQHRHEKYPHFDGEDNHPSNAERVAYMQQLVIDLEEEQQKQTTSHVSVLGKIKAYVTKYNPLAS